MKFMPAGKQTVAAISVACAVLSLVACGGPKVEEDLRGDLASLAGRMAAEKDLRDVRIEDLNHDGAREVILVFGPRELLDFDVFYRTQDGAWQITPMVNDQDNPREFVGARLEKISDANGDSLPELTVSSRLYDGNTMVKDLQWSPTGYKVVAQRTVVAGAAVAPKPQETPAAAPARTAPEKTVAQSTAPASAKSEPVKKAEPPKPKPKPMPVMAPEVGVYQVRRGDTIFGIATALGVTPDKLESMNNNQLQRRGLRVGQRINVPVPAGKNAKVKVQIEKEKYTVQRGDTLISIANRFGVSTQAIRSWNPSIPEDGGVKVGQSLNIHHAVLSIS
ncbi:LysM peptidoglycan-binding domain-containing protein [bacterium]|nr:LysM peptidoglycan-binding domain-containing protein [bacterium]